VEAGDFPAEWLGLSNTVEIEAKAKELAVLSLSMSLTEATKKRHNLVT